MMCPSLRLLQAADAAHQRTLPGAAEADDTLDDAACYGEVNASERLNSMTGLLIHFADIDEGEDRLRHCLLNR